MTLTPLNPDGLFTSPAFHQGVLAEGTRTVYVGGQNGTDASGALVPGGLAEQSAQAMRNVLAVLKEAGADQTHVAKLGVYLKAGSDPQEGFAATTGIWGQHPVAITGYLVAALARPDALVEIEAVAVL